MASLNVLLCVFLLFCFIESGLTIKCYNCTSSVSGICGNKFEKKTAIQITCPASAKNCLQGIKDGEAVKACADTDDIESCKKSKSCHVCDKDLCNSSTAVAFSKILILFTVLAYKYI